MKKNTIKVPLESWLYLQNVCRNQRCGDQLSERVIERLTREYKDHYEKNGGYTLIDGDLGGAIGDPQNSYEDGRWTSWKVEDMKVMLREQNLPYQDGEPIDEIDVYF